jgi:Ran GTPase-activating protein (RanGAP) involved in mRNA processing and transport
MCLVHVWQPAVSYRSAADSESGFSRQAKKMAGGKHHSTCKKAVKIPMVLGGKTNLLDLTLEILATIFKGQMMKGRLVCKRISQDLTPAFPAVLHASFVVDGRTFAAVPPYENLGGMTGKRLQTMCRERNLSSSGRRGECIDRLKAYQEEKQGQWSHLFSDWRDTISRFVSRFPEFKGIRLCLQAHKFYENKKQLKLGNMHLRLADVYSKLDELSQIKNLTEIDFSTTLQNEPIDRGLESSVKALTKVLGHATSLTSLKFGVETCIFDPFHLEPPIAESIANGLQNCRLLKRMELSNFVFDEVSSVIFSSGFRYTPLLQYLDLQYASISPEAVQNLAEGLEHTPSMTSLRVRAFHRFRARRFQLFFGIALGLDGTSRLMEGLKHTPSLTLLDISGGGLRDAGAQALAEGLTRLTRLTDLNMDGCEFSSAGVDVLLHALGSSAPLLTALGFGNLDIGISSADQRPMGNGGARALAASLHLLPRLTSLGVARCSIGESGARALAEVLHAAPALTSLDLTGNSLGRGLGPLLAAATRLQRLNLSGDDQERSLPGLRAGLLHLTALTELDLSGVDLSPGAANALKGLRGAPDLTSLRLSNCHLDPNCAGNLVQLLQGATGLSSLDLSDNALSAGGAGVLAQGLRCATALTELELGSTDLKDAGIDHLAEALGGLPALAMLDLSDNGLRNAGASRLAAALRGATALVQVDLRANFIGEAGAGRLCRALRRSPPARCVDIRCGLSNPRTRARAHADFVGVASWGLHLPETPHPP